MRMNADQINKIGSHATEKEKVGVREETNGMEKVGENCNTHLKISVTNMKVDENFTRTPKHSKFFTHIRQGLDMRIFCRL